MKHAGCTVTVVFAVVFGAVAPSGSGGPGILPDEDSAQRGRSAPPSATTPAAVDAVDAGVARLLVGPYPPQVYTVDAERLPEGAREGSALRIEGALTDGLRDAHLILDPEATERRQARIRGKLQRLRRGAE